MRAREGCSLLAFGCLFVVVACLVFAALVGAMVLSGEVPLYPPHLTAFEPEPDQVFRPTTPITLTFDQVMDPVSVEAGFSLIPAVPGTFQWSEDRTRVVFVPSAPGYEPGESYTARVPAGLQAGTLPRVTERGKEWRFSLLPLLAGSSPAPEEQDLGAWTRLEARFNYPLDCALTLETFSITPRADGKLMCGDQTLSFELAQPLEPGTAYVAGFEHVFLQDDPSVRQGVRWSLQTAPPLAVVDVFPEADPLLVDLWTPFRVAFNRPVVAESAVSRFSMTDDEGVEVKGILAWGEGGEVLVFQPDEPLRPDRRYDLVLQEGVEDELGFRLAGTLAQSYGTAALAGVPSPESESTDVRLDSAIRIPFTRPMDEVSVEAGLVFTPSLEGTIVWEEDTLVLTPRDGLAAETAYEVSVSEEVRDASGAPLAERLHWTFETEPLLLAASVPSDIVLMELRQPVEFTFALPMSRRSVLGALSIAPQTPGDLIWSEDDRTVRFEPDPAWQAGSDYEVRLSGQARTADGAQGLGEDRTWRFSTAGAEVRFGDGPNIQVLDAGGDRGLQVEVQGADVAGLALYAITPTQFLDLYSSGFRGIGPPEPQIVDTAGLTPTVVWREALALWDEEAPDSGWRMAEAHVPPDVPSGLYVLTGQPPSEVQGQLLLILSHHALVLKRALAGGGSARGPGPTSSAQILAWDTEISSGAPVVSATLRLYDRDGTFLAEGQTDDEGLLALDTPGDPGPLLALSEKDGDVTVCGLSGEWSEAGWWLWWSEPPSRPLYVTYSYTDRPIYRPGQDIYYRNIVRADDDVSYTLPGPDLPVRVRLRDARDNVAATQVLTPTQFGTVHGTFRLADEPMLGTWNLETEVEGEVTRQTLKVEEYRKPDYEVTVHTPKAAYIQGEAISVTVQTAYYFGQPVGGAEVVLSVYPSYPDEYVYGEGADRFGYPLLTEEGRTDGDGQWTLVLPTQGVFSQQDWSRRAMLALEATVTDETGASVSSYQTVVIHRTSRGLSILMEKHGYEPNEEIAFTAQVLDLEGLPVAGVELVAAILGWDDGEVASAAVTTEADGRARFSVRIAEQGWFRLRVDGTEVPGGTGEGTGKVEADEWLWVYDPSGQAPWYHGQWGEAGVLGITADRTTYTVGETAQLLVYTATPGPALLTFERGQTRHAEPVTLVSGTNLISVPVRSDYRPNIHVTVNQFGPPVEDGGPGLSRPEVELHTASTELLVPVTEGLLTVTLTSDASVYAADEEVTFQVEVTDQAGQPVVAEVSVAVVDEAIYALAEDTSRDPFEMFYGPRPNLVRTYDSLRPTRWLYPLYPAAGLGGGAEEAAGAPRREFLDTAYWAPTVITDEHGEATVTFTLPDNLTEWRALARAVTTDTMVGQATARVVVSQDIVVRPALPRFLIQGDTTTLVAVVHNFTGRPVSATVDIEVEGLVLAEADTAMILSVPAGGSAVAGWQAVAEASGDYAGDSLPEARVTVRATATYGGARLAGRDAVEMSLPVHPPAAPEVAAFAGTLTPDRPTSTLTITLAADAIEGLSRLEINVAPSIAPGLLDGLEYLIDYPFG